MTTQAVRRGGRECPVYEGTPNECKATVRPGHLMCRRHWAQVPTAIREAVWKRWRAWERTSTEAAWDHYMAARQEALDVFTKTDRADLPSDGLTQEDLDGAAVVLVVATDGSTRMWWEDRGFALAALSKMWEQLATAGDTPPVKDGRG